MDRTTNIGAGLRQGEVRIESYPRNFLGYLPKTLRHVLAEGLDHIIEKHLKATGVLLRGEIPCGVSQTDDDIWAAERIEDFPDAVASVGFDRLFSRDFVKRFVKKECFRNVWEGGVNRVFDGVDLEDPEGRYTLYAVQPFVMLMDRRGAGKIPIPRKWSDLLEPEFRRKVILGGSDNPTEDVPLVYFYKEYGVEGVARIAANVKAVWYAWQVGPMVDAGQAEGPAVYILPWAYAKACDGIDGTSVIWPEDGALVNPLCLLVKKKKATEVAPIVEHIIGIEAGRDCVRCGLVSANPNVENGLPVDASFKWLGWDYIKSRDASELRERIYKLFIVMRREMRGKK